MPSETPFLDFIRAAADELRKDDRRAQSRSLEWNTWREKLRKNLVAAWGGFPSQAAPLEPKTLGELKRDGYRVEKIIFQTRPGVWMTANLYVPDQSGKLPGGPPRPRPLEGREAGPSRAGPLHRPGEARLRRAGGRRLRRRRARRRHQARRVPRRDDRRHALADRPAAVGPAGLREHAGRRLPADAARGRRRKLSASPAPAAAATRRCTPARATSGSRPSCRSARSATTRRTSAPPAACARSCPAR